MSDELFTVKEAAAELRISVSTLYRMFKSGQIVPVKVRGRTFVRQIDIRTFLYPGN